MASYPPKAVTLSLGWAWKEGALLPLWVWVDSPVAATSLHRSSGGLKGPVTIESCPLRALGWCYSTSSLDLPHLGLLWGSWRGLFFGPFTAFQGLCPKPPCPLWPQYLRDQLSGADLPPWPLTHSLPASFVYRPKCITTLGKKKKDKLICPKFLMVDECLLY